MKESCKVWNLSGTLGVMDMAELQQAQCRWYSTIAGVACLRCQVGFFSLKLPSIGIACLQVFRGHGP